MGLRTRFMNWLVKGQGNSTMSKAFPNDIVARDDSIDMDNALRFSVLSAHGGTVVQIRHYDKKTDRNSNITHVIPDGEDISTAIGHIVSMEILRS